MYFNHLNVVKVIIFQSENVKMKLLTPSFLLFVFITKSFTFI